MNYPPLNSMLFEVVGSLLQKKTPLDKTSGVFVCYSFTKIVNSTSNGFEDKQ